jgi:hypothetical protein
MLFPGAYHMRGMVSYKHGTCQPAGGNRKAKQNTRESPQNRIEKIYKKVFCGYICFKYVAKRSFLYIFVVWCRDVMFFGGFVADGDGFSRV